MALTSIRIEASRAAVAQHLRDSEERFKQLAALAADWYWESDADDRVTLLPESYQDLTGVDPATRIGQPAWPSDGSGFATGAYEAFRRTLDERQPFYAVEYRRADFRGEGHPPLWLSISGEPVFDPDGAFVGYRGTTANITARRAAEERATRSSRLYAALGEVSEMVAAGGDESTILESACSALHDVARFDQVSIRTVNESGAELVPVAFRGWQFETLSRYRLTPVPEGAADEGYAPLSELSARAYLEACTLHTADYQQDPALQQSWAQARLQEIGSLLAVPLRRGATTVGVLTVGSRQRDHFDADYIALVERVANAVSLALEARDALNRLAANEERFRRLNDIAADWIWESDAALRLNYLSPAYYELTQARPQDVLGVALGEMIPALDNETARREFLAAVAARQPFRDFEYVRRDADGSLRWRSLSAEPVVDAERGFMGYRGTGRDISQRKRHEAELVRQANHDALTGSAQPGPAVRPARARDPEFEARRALGGRAAARPRPVQADQRQLRPPGRRRRAARARNAAGALRARQRHDRAPGRRRVRRAA